ncbi:MAG: hypothetical protein WA875_09225 [Candidatus Acidiferrales bacterium]
MPARGLFVVTVRSFSGELEFLIGLIEEFLGFRGVAIEIPLVGRLCGDDLVEGLIGEALRSGEIGMARCANVTSRFLSQSRATADEGDAEKAAEERVLEIHDVKSSVESE